MTHEGRMARGKEKYEAGKKDSEVDYFLEHSKEVKEEKPKKKVKKEEAKE